MSNTLESMEIVPTGGPVGAEVRGIDLSQPVPGEAIHRMVRAFEEHHLLLWRGQELSHDRQLEVTEWFGPRHYIYDNMPILGDASQPPLITISNVTDDGLLGSGDIVPHQDTVYLPTPLAGALLYAAEVPQAGGDTSWSNLIQAYDELDEQTKALIANLRVFNYNPYAGAKLSPELGGKVQKWVHEEPPRFEHPLVRIHPPTGRKILWLHSLTEELIGLEDPAQTQALLERLKAHVDQSHLYYTHHWQVGDAILWDNRCCNHKRDAIPDGQRRVFYRTMMGGTRPY
jgi:taurine dioxygenase